MSVGTLQFMPSNWHIWRRPPGLLALAALRRALADLDRGVDHACSGGAT
jgi:hypothetical protein